MTLKELEYYIVYWITKVYHQKKHSALGTSPIVKWEECLGTKTTAGTGLKERVSDVKIPCLLIFYLEFEATIQRTGVQKDNLFYFADCLRQWVNSIDPEDNNRKRKRKFLFKRDPRIFHRFGFMSHILIPILKYLLQSERYHRLAYLNISRFRTISKVNVRMFRIRMRFTRRFCIYVINLIRLEA